MALKKTVLFIINPIAGGKSKDKVPGLIESNLDKNLFDYQIEFTKAPKQAKIIAENAVGKFDIIIAVGGDGTVNEIASALAGKNAIFGILPYGSGNGLSRFLDIPMDTEAAIKNLNFLKTEIIDGAKLNGKWFFNMAGMGFDAHISQVFAQEQHRGFSTYLKSSLKEVLNYEPHTYDITVDGKHVNRKAFMLSFANSSQYGNNAHISPYASVQDGFIDVCIIKPFPVWRYAEMAVRIFGKWADSSSYVEIIKGKHIQIKRVDNGPIHLDGEPQHTGSDIDIQVIPNALKIIVGKNYKRTDGK